MHIRTGPSVPAPFGTIGSVAVVLFLASLSTTAGSQALDPLKSPACGRSVAALEAARAGSVPAGEVDALRREANLACLGGSGKAIRPAPAAQPPVVVAPPVIESRRRRQHPLPPRHFGRRWRSSARRWSRPATPAAAGPATASG